MCDTKIKTKKVPPAVSLSAVHFLYLQERTRFVCLKFIGFPHVGIKHTLSEIGPNFSPRALVEVREKLSPALSCRCSQSALLSMYARARRHLTAISVKCMLN
jgi:hypothetical protein